MNRNERKRQLNTELSVLPTFVPIQDCRIRRIDHTTESYEFYHLIKLARITDRYTIDTEKDIVTRQPALIQVEFLGTESIVLVVQVCHLPRAGSSLLWMMQALFKIILAPSNRFYAWGDLKRELADFVPCGLISSELIRQMQEPTDVQQVFKGWYNRTFTHDCRLSSSGVVDDHPSCTCSHRPMKNQKELWSLQRAVAYAFGEFLDKSRTKSRWGQPIRHVDDIRRSDIIQKHRKSLFDQLLLYAIDDCLAVTKLAMVIESSWSKRQLQHVSS